MNDKVQNQTGGAYSQNFQGGAAGTMVVNAGLSIADAKEIVLLLVEQDFARFSEKAVVVARERAEQMVDEFLQKISAKNPGLVQSVESPGMQMALIKAQQEHIKAGDETIRDILVNALVERASLPERSITQISVDESLNAIGKLTIRQIDMLSLCLTLHYVVIPLEDVFPIDIRNMGADAVLIASKGIIRQTYDSFIKNFLGSGSIGYSSYEHIAVCNCGDIFIGAEHFALILLRTYPGLFSVGFSDNELLAMGEIKSVIEEHLYDYIFIPCLSDSSLKQLIFLNNQQLDAWAEENKVSSGMKKQLQFLLNNKVLNEQQMIKELSTWGEEMNRLLNVWNSSHLPRLTLNNIGKVVAAMNYNRIYNTSVSLSNWIQE